MKKNSKAKRTGLIIGAWFVVSMVLEKIGIGATRIVISPTTVSSPWQFIIPVLLFLILMWYAMWRWKRYVDAQEMELEAKPAQTDRISPKAILGFGFFAAGAVTLGFTLIILLMLGLGLQGRLK
jgi:hypothetical protein